MNVTNSINKTIVYFHPLPYIGVNLGGYMKNNPKTYKCIKASCSLLFFES